MTTQVPNPNINASNEVLNQSQHTVDKYLLSFPCIICINNIVNVGCIYDLVDFLDYGEIVVTRVKFFDAYVTGYRVTIVVLNIKTGELLKRSHRIDNDELACNFVLTDLFTKPESNKESKSQCHEINQ